MWRGADIEFESVYQTLVLDDSKSGSFIIQVKDEAAIGVFVYGSYRVSGMQHIVCRIVVSYSVRLRVARSTWMGTCQSLESWDE